MSGHVPRLPMLMGASALGRYGGALAITTCVIIINLLFADIIGFSTPFLLIETAIWCAVLFGGMGPGIVTVLLAGAVTTLFLLQDESADRSTYPVHAVLFLIQSALILCGGAAYRRATHNVDRRYSLFRTFIDNAPMWHWVKDANGAFALINRNVEQFLGMSSEEVLGRRADELMPDHADVIGQVERTVLDVRLPVESMERTVFRGEERYWHAIRFPLVDQEGSVLVGGIAYDVTDFVAAERSLSVSERQFRRIVETAREGIVTVDGGGRITFANGSAAEMVGYTTEEIATMPVVELFSPRDRERARRMLLNTGDAIDDFAETQFRRKDGSTFTALAASSRLTNSYGRSDGVLLVFCDIVVGKRAELVATAVSEQLEDRVEERTRGLASAIDQLEQANEVLKQFLADASHDIRTPLTIVQSEVDLMLRAGNTSGDVHESLLRVRTETQRIDNLIDDLLFLARIDSDSFEMRSSVLRLDELILDTISNLRTLSSMKDIAWNVDFTSTIKVRCDRPLLERAIRNVIENAVKYSPNGSVVHVSMRGVDACAIIVVADEGPGIPKDDLPNVFERFYRAETTRAIPGTGLGLSIVKSAVEACEGMVRIDSELGRGTTVTIELPCT